MGIPNIITFANDKGGNGKTTCAVNLAYLFSTYGYKTLLIDTDAQCNATDRLQVDRLETKNTTIFEYFFNKNKNLNIESYIYHTKYNNLDVIVGDLRFNTLKAEVEICLNGPSNGIRYYVNLINDLVENTDYDYVFIDTHPSSTDKIKPIFEVADYILIPTDLDGQSDTGGMRLIKYVDTLRENDAAKTRFIGFIPYRLDERTNIVKAVMPELKSKYAVFDTIIPQSEIVKQATRMKEPTPAFNKSAKVSKAFDTLAKEVLSKIGQKA